jgi:hypothetical protein
MRFGYDVMFLISLYEQAIEARVLCIVVLHWTSLPTIKATVSSVEQMS